MITSQTKVTADDIVDISIQIRHHGWTDDIAELEELCRRAAHTTLAALEIDGALELSLVLADDKFVQDLNRNYRHQDKPTNVLSFPGDMTIENGPRILGDVIIAYETSKREAAEMKIKLADHVSHLIVHGVLHLLGYDHESDREADQMEGRERDILARLHIADPYG